MEVKSGLWRRFPTGANDTSPYQMKGFRFYRAENPLDSASMEENGLDLKQARY